MGDDKGFESWLGQDIWKMQRAGSTGMYHLTLPAKTRRSGIYLYVSLAPQAGPATEAMRLLRGSDTRVVVTTLAGRVGECDSLRAWLAFRSACGLDVQDDADTVDHVAFLDEFLEGAPLDSAIRVEIHLPESLQSALGLEGEGGSGVYLFIMRDPFAPTVQRARATTSVWALRAHQGSTIKVDVANASALYFEHVVPDNVRLGVPDLRVLSPACLEGCIPSCCLVPCARGFILDLVSARLKAPFGRLPRAFTRAFVWFEARKMGPTATYDLGFTFEGIDPPATLGSYWGPVEDEEAVAPPTVPMRVYALVQYPTWVGEIYIRSSCHILTHTHTHTHSTPDEDLCRPGSFCME
jgi:hypothetical protein